MGRREKEWGVELGRGGEELGRGEGKARQDDYGSEADLRKMSHEREELEGWKRKLETV